MIVIVIMISMFILLVLDSADQACMFRRPLALGAAGGSLASFALRVLQNSVDPGIPIIPESIDCLCPTPPG